MTSEVSAPTRQRQVSLSCPASLSILHGWSLLGQKTGSSTDAPHMTMLLSQALYRDGAYPAGSVVACHAAPHSSGCIADVAGQTVIWRNLYLWSKPGASSASLLVLPGSLQKGSGGYPLGKGHCQRAALGRHCLLLPACQVQGFMAHGLALEAGYF